MTKSLNPFVLWIQHPGAAPVLEMRSLLAAHAGGDFDHVGDVSTLAGSVLSVSLLAGLLESGLADLEHSSLTTGLLLLSTGAA